MTRVYSRRPMADRLWDKVDASGDCWEWTGSLDGRSYGHLMGDGGRTVKAHRAAYQTLVGPIPAGLDLDHLCRNRSCVNPDHLEPVTRSENLRRSPLVGRRSNLTSCPQGHPYDDANTYVDKRGRRGCKQCRREATRRWRLCKLLPLSVEAVRAVDNDERPLALGDLGYATPIDDDKADAIEASGAPALDAGATDQPTLDGAA